MVTLLTSRQLEESMATLSIKFYTVTMPDGKQYCACGPSKKRVAEACHIDVSKVKSGARSGLPYVSTYVAKT